MGSVRISFFPFLSACRLPQTLQFAHEKQFVHIVVTVTRLGNSRSSLVISSLQDEKLQALEASLKMSMRKEMDKLDEATRVSQSSLCCCAYFRSTMRFGAHLSCFSVDSFSDGAFVAIAYVRSACL